MFLNKTLIFFFIFSILLSSFVLSYNLTYSNDTINSNDLFNTDCLIQSNKGNNEMSYQCLKQEIPTIINKELKIFAFNVFIVFILTGLFFSFFKNSKNKILKDMARYIHVVDYIMMSMFLFYILFVF